MDELQNILSRLVQTGTVTAVDSAKRRARVKFKDTGIISDWLYVLQHYGANFYIKPDAKHTHEITDTFTGGGTASEFPDHDHLPGSHLTYWMPNNVTWSGSARYATHQRHGTHALTEFTGLDPDKMTFDIVLSAYLGVDPIAEVVKLWNYERGGIAVPLVIGNKGYGKYRWSVLDHKMKMKTYDGRGNVTSATVSVSLQEYLRG